MSNDERIYVSPPDVYARHERSGLVKYPREQVIAARDVALAAEDEYRAMELEVGRFLQEQEEVVCGPAYAYRALAFDKYAPDSLRPLMEWVAPSSDFGGTGGNLYPVAKWQTMARTFRARAARLRKMLDKAKTEASAEMVTA